MENLQETVVSHTPISTPLNVQLENHHKHDKHFDIPE